MQFDLMMQAARATIERPRDAARWIIAQNYSFGTAALALITAAVVTSILSGLVMLSAPSEMMTFTPAALAFYQTVGLFIMAGLIKTVGSWAGGTGRLEDAIALLAWIEAVMILLQVVQIAAMFILPPISLILTVVGFGLMVWLLVHFIAELHGFQSRAKVLAGMVMTLIGAVFLLALLIGIFIGDTNV